MPANTHTHTHIHVHYTYMCITNTGTHTHTHTHTHTRIHRYSLLPDVSSSMHIYLSLDMFPTHAFSSVSLCSTCTSSRHYTTVSLYCLILMLSHRPQPQQP